MKSLNINEVLDMIDKRFGYEFSGKDKTEHLISRQTWTSYVIDYLDINQCSSSIEGERRHTRYPLEIVEAVISFKEELLIKQLNSNRKTIKNKRKISMEEAFAAIAGEEVDPKIYAEKIFKKQNEQIEAAMYPVPSEEDIQNTKDSLLEIIIDQLIDVEKINYDVKQQLISGSLHHGLATPLESIEDQDGNVLGFKIDATNYLKHEIKTRFK
ncbi:hypothetical protein [Exiguobacterium mexicanum]|uniref:hypothetical protein n=1 Tax=Exiguobacterium mexicanum TaxID=340146 RepID=UPI00384BD61A